MARKSRWAAADLRDRLANYGAAGRAFCEMPESDREAGIALVQEHAAGSVVRAKVAFFRVFGWVPTMAELTGLGATDE